MPVAMIPALGGRPTGVSTSDARAEVVLLHGGAEVASWALMVARRPDLALVDDLARLQLAARRLGCCIRLRQACPEMSGLLELVGLGQLLLGGPGPALQVGGEAEGAEEVGVEEVVVPDDPVA